MNLSLLKYNMIFDTKTKDLLANPLPPIKIADKPAYSVGVASDGRTQLMINGEFGTSILTMDANAVETMIRLLEATLYD